MYRYAWAHTLHRFSRFDRLGRLGWCTGDSHYLIGQGQWSQMRWLWITCGYVEFVTQFSKPQQVRSPIVVHVKRVFVCLFTNNAYAALGTF